MYNLKLARRVNQIKMENKQNRQGIILIALTLFLLITEGCRSNPTQLEAKQPPVQVGATLAPASTLPPGADTQSSGSTLPALPTLHEFIPVACMEEQSKEFIIAPGDPRPTYFVDEQRVILPLRICTDSYSGGRRSDYNWLFSIQINSITTADGRPLDKWPRMYLRYRRLPGDSGYIRGNEGAVYALRYEARTNKHHGLGAGDRGIYDLVFEFEDMDTLDRIPQTIDVSITVEIWYI